MTKIDIISGFLGAGKTTFIQKLIREALRGQKVVLIENEFGEIGIDGGFLKDAGIEIREMNQGCICCSLVGDFETSLHEVIEKYAPDRIIIEPSGVGKLSDIIGAVKSVSANLDVELNAAVTIVDAKKAKMYARNFGEFFNNQIQYAGTVVLSRTDIADEKKIEEAVGIVRGINPDAVIITTPEEELTGEQLLDIISRPDTMEEDMMREVMERVKEHEHEHDDDDDDDDDDACECGHHHHDEDDEGEHHDGEVHIHNHHHHHHHHHGEDHDADEIFTSWGLETPHSFTREKLDGILKRMSESDEFGTIIRCKGMLPTAEAGKWMHFDMVPEQYEIRDGAADYTGKVVVIGSDLKEDALKRAFVGE